MSFRLSAAATRRHFLSLSGLLLAAATALPLAGGPARAEPVTLEAIKKAGVVKVGVEAAYRPFTFRDKGEIVGYDVDLAKEIFAPLGVKVEFIDTAWAGVIPALYAGNFDVIMTSLTYTKERVAKVGYSIPYTEATQEMLIRASDADTIKNLDGMAGKTLGVKLGSAGDTMKTKLEEKLKADTGKGFAEVKAYDDHPAAYLSLSQGSVDGVINSLATLTQVMKDAPGKYVIVRDIGPRNWAGIGTRKEDIQLIDFLNERINALKADGAIYKLQEKWFGTQMKLSDKIPDFS
ncbi:amino acid ABC transporter substrate-binding protein (PAAT family) [Ancylobacter aquaticus]|uniref:Amino acid ABC transporter substrate-binding protein (PAAT family) n=1 Tax=Ancylobacter aquaticus TaxID=100 RepID=A0A4R1I0F3_ANCAQ|nr:transporter substrate-binding domain-containing protein [Ancylobacter aquaticus]TCK28168.1 amino acid ABC transporter substrate-binding protein (PAAT family) [Ancylobacter aquaticus]